MIVFVVALGLCIGSFLNVCIYRIPREESISFPPSHCTTCGYKLKAYDLIPVLSYMFLKGRCRKCKEKISLQYPLIELLNAILYAGIYYRFGMSFEFVKFSALSSALIVIGVIDLKTGYVYSNTIIFTAILGLLFFTYEWVNTKEFPINLILGAVIGFSIIYIIVKLTGGMGEGDIEIAAISGLFFGMQNTILVLCLSFILGAIIACILLLLKIKSRKDEMPFGPYISLAAIVTIFIGTNLIKWYCTFF